MEAKKLYLLMFIMFLSMAGYGIIMPILPYFADELGLTSFQMSSLITGWAFTQFLVLPLWGKIIDKVGRRPVLLFGLFGFGIAFISMMFAQSYIQLLLIRIVGAILSSGTQPAVFALLADSSEPHERGRTMSKMGAANGLGFLIGPLLGSALSPFGITTPFIVAGLLSLLVIPLVFLYIQEPERKRQKVDNLPFSQIAKTAFKHDYFILFMTTLGVAIATSSILGILGYFMIQEFDATTTQTGLAFMIQSMSVVFVQLVIMAKMYKYFTETTITNTGILINALGFSCLIWASDIVFVYVGVGLIGIGQAFIKPTLLTLLSKKQGLGQGMVMSLQGAYDSLGRSIGPLIAGSVFMFNSVAPFFISLVICLVLFICLKLDQIKMLAVVKKQKEV